MSRFGQPERVDVLIGGAVVVTMNTRREVLRDGAVAVRDRDIVAVGTTSEVDRRCLATERIDGSGYVIVPGLVNAHLHATTEPLTRGVVPDDTAFDEHVFGWLSPLAAAYSEHDEYLAAQLGAVESLKSGTTTILEAGTGWSVDAAVDGLSGVGIRARVGRRVWDRPEQPVKFRQTTEQAIAGLEEVVTCYPSHAGSPIEGFVTLVGHTTCSDDLWRAAREIADRHHSGINFHMSPSASDPEAFDAEFGQRPMIHLSELGVLGPDVVAVHCVHVDDSEVAVMADAGCNVVHCPTTALKVAYGVTQIGKFPEMASAGINLAIGTDGCNASNYSDLYRASYLVAGLFKDARQDPAVFPAEEVLEMATLGGARALGASSHIGSIEVGKRADFVLHERDRPEWTPLLDVPNQLIYSVDGRSVHTVFVDGRKVVDDHRVVDIDEERLFAQVAAAAKAVIERAGLKGRTRWTMR